MQGSDAAGSFEYLVEIISVVNPNPLSYLLDLQIADFKQGFSVFEPSVQQIFLNGGAEMTLKKLGEVILAGFRSSSQFRDAYTGGGIGFDYLDGFFDASFHIWDAIALCASIRGRQPKHEGLKGQCDPFSINFAGSGVGQTPGYFHKTELCFLFSVSKIKKNRNVDPLVVRH